MLDTCCGVAHCVDAAFACPGPLGPAPRPGEMTITGVVPQRVPPSGDGNTLPK